MSARALKGLGAPHDGARAPHVNAVLVDVRRERGLGAAGKLSAPRLRSRVVPGGVRVCKREGECER